MLRILPTTAKLYTTLFFVTDCPHVEPVTSNYQIFAYISTISLNDIYRVIDVYRVSVHQLYLILSAS